jgi:hypothetical protein
MPFPKHFARLLATAPTVDEAPQYGFRFCPTGIHFTTRGGLPLGDIYPNGTAKSVGGKAITGIERCETLDDVAARFMAHYEARK